MLKKNFCGLGLACVLAFSSAGSAFADQTAIATTTMENCGAYLFEWRPIDCGDGYYFAILVGGNTLYENNVILNRGYDYIYTFDYTIPRPWGQVPALVNMDGMWAIPENQVALPEGTQPALRVTLKTNNTNLATKERYIDVVSLPAGVNPRELPSEVRKYLINVDGSDAGAYDGTEASGWVENDGVFRYRKPDGTFVTNSWLKVEDEEYYMNEAGIMLTDTITPDGIYVNSKGEKTSYIPGWTQMDGQWKYVQKNGYYAAASWVEDTDGKYYYFNMAGRMLMNETTPDGYYVDANGVWDGQPSTISQHKNLGPGSAVSENIPSGPEGVWEESGGSWKYKLSNGDYITNNWFQDIEGKWYYFDDSSLMVTNGTTPDGYYVGADGVWNES